MTVNHAGQIGAGKVVPFNALNDTQRTIAVPVELRHAYLMTFDVAGDSFADEDIRDGDVLVARRSFDLSEVTPGRLCLVRICDNEMLLKRVYAQGGMVRLASSNPVYEDMYYSDEFIEIVAIVEGRTKFEPIK